MDQTRSWEWQIRDSKGRWIEMNAQVSFMANGQSVTGKVIGSPKPGLIVVQTADGRQISIPSSAVTVTAPGAPQDLASATKKAPQAPKQATAPKRAKAVLHGGTKALSASKDPETDAPTDRRLRGVHAVSSQIERALRVAAKEQGLSNPFGSADDKPREKTPAERRDAQKKSAEKAAEKAKEKDATDSKDKPEKKRVDHRKKLTQSQIDAVSEILKKVLTNVRDGKFSDAMGDLKKAEALLKNTSAPWLSKRISYLKRGVATFSLTAAAGPKYGWTAIPNNTPKPRPSAYKPKPWLWQLRDRIGQWIEMHSEVTWSASGQTKRGIVTGSPEVGVATVKEAKTGREVRLPTSRLTSAFALPHGNMHSEADNPGELIIHSRKATKIRLDVPTPEPMTTPAAAPVPVAPKDLSTLSNDELRDLYWALRDHPKVKMTTWMRVAIAIAARHIEVDPHSGGYLPAGALAAGGNSWQWQLRDSKGQWIDMGARVRWFDRGAEFLGTIVGSPQPGTAYIKVDGDDVNNGVHAIETDRLIVTDEPIVTDAVAVTGDDAPDDWSLDYTYRLDSQDIRLLQEKADAINKRAARRGLTGEVSIVATPTDNPNIFEVKIIGTPKLPGGWTLTAVIDGSGDGAIVNRNPRDPSQTEIDRTKAGDCDYCKTARDRVKTYVLRDDAGTVKYVGSSCLNDFLGHRVSLGANPWGSEDDFDGLAGFAGGMSKTRTEEALYYAAVMINTFGFVKTSEPGSTRDAVSEILRVGERKFEQDLQKKRRGPHELTHPDPEAWAAEQAAILEWMKAGESMWDNDYRRNLAAIVHRGAVDWKTMGLTVSAVSSYRREQDRERERAARAKATRAEILNELLAPVGTKVKDVPVKIISANEYESQWGVSTRVTMMDEQGHRIVWWASNFPDGFEPGDEVTVSATVKKADEYRGVMSTVVTRAKLVHKAVTASAWEGDGLMPLAAAGDSWRWQLRDKDGQWIRMGSRVSWAANGMIHVGEVIGSPKDGTALVREDRDGTTHHMPSKRLTALPTVGDRVRHTGGGKTAKASLAEVIGIPKKGRVTIRHLLTGKEEDVAEKTLAILQLDRMRELVREQGGASVKIDGTEPSTGYMVAQLDGGMVVTAEEFYGPDGAKYLFDFMRANAKRFKDPDVYIGLWYDEDAEPPRVTLDVAHNVQDRNDAILFGQYQDQRKIWDVVKMEEIDTGGTGGYADGTEADGVRPADQGRGRDDGRGTDGVVPAGGYEDRHWIRRPPPLGGLRVADARSSMASFGPAEWAFINNGGGTLADPEHIKTGRGALTAAPSDMVDHYTDVLRNALNGIPESEGVDPATLEHAHLWYEGANEVCANMLKEFTAKYPQSGLTMEKITGVMAAMSPRMKWAQNIESCRRVIEAECSGHLDGIPMEQAKTMTKAGCYDYVEDALYILRGSTEMTGLKRKSFWNCMLDPSNTWDVCMDGWMASATRRAGLTHLDGTPLEESTLSWLDHGLDNADSDLVEGAGYVVLADALRIAAARVGLTPLQAQALYWVSVGGGVEDKVVVMWTDERRARGTSPKALRKAELERQQRLDAALSPVEVMA